MGVCSETWCMQMEISCRFIQNSYILLFVCCFVYSSSLPQMPAWGLSAHMVAARTEARTIDDSQPVGRGYWENDTKLCIFAFHSPRNSCCCSAMWTGRGKLLNVCLKHRYHSWAICIEYYACSTMHYYHFCYFFSYSFLLLIYDKIARMFYSKNGF